MVREVVEAIDGPVCLNQCLMDGASCSRKGFCAAHPIWVRAQEAMLGVLNTATVLDLASHNAAPRVRLAR